jgi:hypothetical protein
MNISWYYIALGPNSIVFIILSHMLCMLLENRKNKEENRARQYLYPDQKFCSGPNRLSCKTFLDYIILSWPLQLTSNHQQSFVAWKTDLQITNSYLLMIWLILNSQYGSNENSSTHRKTICLMSHKSLDLLDGQQKTSDDPVMDHVADPITLSMICCGVAGVSSDSMIYVSGSVFWLLSWNTGTESEHRNQQEFRRNSSI